MSFRHKWQRMQLRTGWPFGPWITLAWMVVLPAFLITLSYLHQWYLDL